MLPLQAIFGSGFLCISTTFLVNQYECQSEVCVWTFNGGWTSLSPMVPPNPCGSVIPTSDAEHANCYALSLSFSFLDLVEYQSPTCDLWRICWLQNLWNCSNSKQTEVLKLRLNVGVLPDVPKVCYLVHIVVFTAANEEDCWCKNAKLSPRTTLQSSRWETAHWSPSEYNSVIAYRQRICVFSSPLLA